MKRRGFTLFELTMVITSIGILAAILLPSLARAREQARRSSCSMNLMNMGMAIMVYAQENDRALPWSGGHGNADCLVQFRTYYQPELGCFICSSSGTHTRADFYDEHDQLVVERINAERSAFGSLRGSYDYLGAYTSQPIRLPHPSKPMPMHVPVAWDIYGGVTEERVKAAGQETGSVGEITNHLPGGGNVLWLDGSVTFLLAQEWADLNLPERPPGMELDASINSYTAPDPRPY